MQPIIEQLIVESIHLKQKILSDKVLLSDIMKLAKRIRYTLKNEGKILMAGNGGSFSDSIHIVTEFVCRFQKERAAYAALALGTNNASVTAIANDFDYSKIFSREIEAIGQKRDIFIGLSTSGNSPNIIEAVIAAKKMGMPCCCLTGATGGKLKSLCECLCVPSNVTARIQEAHILIGHILCEIND